MACLAAGGSACCSEQSLKMRPVFLKIGEIRRDRLGPKEKKMVLFIKKIGTVKKLILFIKKSVKKSDSTTSILTTPLNF
jgi:hypothetical protein